jgi:hypothetical protein
MQRKIDAILYDFDDYVEVDSFDSIKFAELQATTKAYALTTIEIIRRLKLEVPEVAFNEKPPEMVREAGKTVANTASGGMITPQTRTRCSEPDTIAATIEPGVQPSSLPSPPSSPLPPLPPPSRSLSHSTRSVESSIKSTVGPAPGPKGHSQLSIWPIRQPTNKHTSPISRSPMRTKSNGLRGSPDQDQSQPEISKVNAATALNETAPSGAAYSTYSPVLSTSSVVSSSGSLPSNRTSHTPNKKIGGDFMQNWTPPAAGDPIQHSSGYNYSGLAEYAVDRGIAITQHQLLEDKIAPSHLATPQEIIPFNENNVHAIRNPEAPVAQPTQSIVNSIGNDSPANAQRNAGATPITVRTSPHHAISTIPPSGQHLLGMTNTQTNTAPDTAAEKILFSPQIMPLRISTDRVINEEEASSQISTSVGSSPAVDSRELSCTIGPKSTLYLRSGFCDGAKMFRTVGHWDAVKKIEQVSGPSMSAGGLFLDQIYAPGQPGSDAAAKCSKCEYMHKYSDFTKDVDRERKSALSRCC